MARGKKSSENAVSLFPFLAVLVCVMGSLIFLLLATTKRMHEIAQREAEAKMIADQPPVVDPIPASLEADIPHIERPVARLGEPAEPVITPAVDQAPAVDVEAEQLRQQLETEWRSKIATLERRHRELKQGLNRQRVLHQAAQKKVAALEVSVKESQTRLRGTLKEIDATKQNQIAAEELAALEAEIMELRRKLRQLQNRPTEGTTKFAVVPYDVRSGTTRRPILIECTDTGLRFLPENVTVKPSDLEGFTERYNPLLAGTTALVKHWTQRNLQADQPGQEPEPYVLLIVRPEGTIAYYVAMRMLSTLKQPFGYELVDDAVELAPPEADPEAVRVCRDAVERQLGDREDVAVRVQDGFRSTAVKGTGLGKPHKSRTDTFEVADVLPQDEGVGERSWENIERFQGRPRKSPATSSPTTAGRSGTKERPPSHPIPASPREASPQVVTATKNGRDAETSTGEPAELGSVDGSDIATANVAPRPFPPGSGPESGETSPNQGQPRRAVPPSTDAGGQTSRRGEMSRPPRGQSSNGRPSGKSGQSEARLEQLARRRWGQSDPNATIGIEQDVTIRVDAQHLVVADDRVVKYHPGEQSFDLFLRVMEAVDAESRTWGKARPGFYWTPRLKFVISPGGNQAFERIDPWTTRSGLSATRVFTLDGVTPTKSEGLR